MPRPSPYDATSVTGHRLTPPKHLNAEERRLFRDIVNDLSPDHFRESDRPLLAQYCILAVMCATRIDKEDPAEMKLFMEASKTMATLAQKMRLVASASLNRVTRAKSSPPKRPWLQDEGAEPFVAETAEEWNATKQ